MPEEPPSPAIDIQPSPSGAGAVGGWTPACIPTLEKPPTGSALASHWTAGPSRILDILMGIHDMKWGSPVAWLCITVTCVWLICLSAGESKMTLLSQQEARNSPKAAPNPGLAKTRKLSLQRETSHVPWNIPFAFPSKGNGARPWLAKVLG